VAAESTALRARDDDVRFRNSWSFCSSRCGVGVERDLYVSSVVVSCFS